MNIDHVLLVLTKIPERPLVLVKSFIRPFRKIPKYSGTPPYDHPVYKTTSLLRPYSFKPNVTTIESFYYFEHPVNATTSLLRPGFYSPTVVVLTGFHCTFKLPFRKLWYFRSGLSEFLVPSPLSLDRRREARPKGARGVKGMRITDDCGRIRSLVTLT